MSGDAAAATTSSSPRPEVVLREAVATLNDLVTFGELDDDERIALAEQIEALTTTSRRPDVTGRESWQAYRRRSPFAGSANPRAPGLKMRVDTAAESPTAVGTVQVGAAFAGPPGFVHGGIVAGLFDEAIGWLASATEPEAALVTGKLNVRFRAPTPIDEPLRFTVSVTRQTSRSLTIDADCHADGRRTATCDALMVIKR